ncbi:hypothetical protein PIROE2DRAFT_10579 [Piromyces sp. E2]|nr:hypothetical protein PIROE2DRAFT_10579 [Piromyces sp. E2]|eukprot:OUM63001.1 hypothetical protein PIROE2DRAFT_10579 [Piromyces sp. E2]
MHLNNFDVYSYCYLADSKVNGNIVPSMGGYKHPDECKYFYKTVSAASGYYQTPGGYNKVKNGPFEYIHARCYNYYGTRCLSEFGWCWCEK